MEIKVLYFGQTMISFYIGYDNYYENQIKTDVTDDVESELNIRCEDIFLSYSELYGKYGTNMIHDAYSDLSSIYENGKFAIIVATYDSINSEKIEDIELVHHFEWKCYAS